MIGDRTVFHRIQGEIPRDLLRELPGVIVAREKPTVIAPRLAATATADLLHLAGCRYAVFEPPTTTLPVAVKPSASPWIRPGVLDGCFDYQKRTIRRLIFNGGGHVWAPAGSGKTRTASCWFPCYERPTLIIAPRITTLQWCDQIEKFTTITPYLLRPRSGRRKKHGTLAAYLAESKFPVVVVGWGTLDSVFHDGYVGDETAKFEHEVIIFDESQYAKARNRRSYSVDEAGSLQAETKHNRSANAEGLARKAKIRCAMTATPVADRLPDLWGQLTLVETEEWGRTARAFLMRYCSGIETPWGVKPGSAPSNPEELAARIDPIVSRVSIEEARAGLPAVRREMPRIPESEFYTGADLSDIHAAIRAVERGEAASLRLAELRLMEAAILVRDAVKDMAIAAKAEGKGKILIFTGRRKEVAWYAKTLSKHFPTSIAYDVERYTARELEDIRSAYFASDGPAVLIGTPEAMGVGIDRLQDTDVMFCALLPWTPEKVEQMEGRGIRHGMTRPLRIVYPIAEGTAAERLRDHFLRKLPSVEAIVGGGTSIGGVRDALNDRSYAAFRVETIAAEMAACDWSYDVD
jgi:hypothetical protein